MPRLLPSSLLLASFLSTMTVAAPASFGASDDSLPADQVDEASLAVTTGDWPMSRRGELHRGRDLTETSITPATVDQLREVWSTTVPYGGDGLVKAGGAVYVDGWSSLAAVDATNGTPLWSHTVPDTARGGVPAVAGGVVYRGVDDSDGGRVLALDASDGTQLWSHTFRPGAPQRHVNALIVSGDVVYGVSRLGIVAALDARTGAVRWEHRLPEAAFSPATLAGGIVYVSTLDGKVYAINARHGHRRWVREIGTGHTEALPVANGLVYVYAFPTSYGRPSTLHALDARTGETRWTASVPGHRGTTSPAVVQGMVIVTSSKSPVRVSAFDALTGEARWSTTVAGQEIGSPTAVRGLVFAPIVRGDGLMHVRAFSTWTGKPVWRSPDLPVRSTLMRDVVIADGTLYALAYDQIHAFRVPGT